MVERLETDVLIYGTGLVSSLVAVGLSSHGIKVILMDPNGDYGSSYRTLSLKNYIIQILKGVEVFHNTESVIGGNLSKFSFKGRNPTFMFNPFGCNGVVGLNKIGDCVIDDNESDNSKGLLDFNDYHIDLWPKMLYCNSFAVTSLVGTGCDNYVQFTAVEGSYIYRNGIFARIPGTKGAIFRSDDFTQLQKRNLWRFLSGVDSMVDIPEFNEFDVDGVNSIFLGDIIYYGLGRFHERDRLCNVLERIKMYISSIGVYGRFNTPFIYPLYGTSDMIQALARASSLAGAVCMLRSKISKGHLNSVSSLVDDKSGYNLTFTVDTYGMCDNELDLSTSEIDCNIILVESHLQDILYDTNQSENMYQLVVPILSIHVAVIIANEKLLEEGVSTSVILGDNQSFLLQLDVSSGTIPVGYYVYYVMGVIECKGGVIDCPHVNSIKELFEKSNRNLSSILFVSHHDTLSDSVDKSKSCVNVEECYSYGMVMSFVDEITTAINVFKKVRSILPDGMFKKSDKVVGVDGLCNDTINSEDICGDFINTDKFNIGKKDDTCMLDRLSALVDEFDGYSLDVNVDDKNDDN